MSLSKETLIQELECKSCNEFMDPPIYLCTSGHSICNRCYPQVEKCPTCRSNKLETTCRNYTLESLYNQAVLPCKYTDAGCKVNLLGKKLKCHEEFCKHGKHACPLKRSTSCNWEGFPADLMIHAQENHDSHTSVVNGKMVRIPNFLQKGSNTTTFQLIEAHGRVFKYGIKLGYSFNTIQWSLQYIGPRNEANEYVLLLSFIDKNKDKLKLMVIASCQVSHADACCFLNDSMCVTLPYATLKTLCDDTGLYFLVRILTIDECENMFLSRN